MMPDPRLCAGEVEGGEEVAGCLEASHGSAPGVFVAVEELLDPVALPVEVAIHGSDHADIAPAGNASPCARGFDGGDHRPAEAAAIGDPVAGRSGRPDEAPRGGLAGGLPRAERQPGGQTAPVHHRVDPVVRPPRERAIARSAPPFFRLRRAGGREELKNYCRPIEHRKQMPGFGRGFSLRLSKVAPNLPPKIGRGRSASDVSPALAQRPPARPRIPISD